MGVGETDVVFISYQREAEAQGGSPTGSHVEVGTEVRLSPCCRWWKAALPCPALCSLPPSFSALATMGVLGHWETLEVAAGLALCGSWKSAAGHPW